MDKVKARRESIVKLLETAPIIPVTEMADLLGVTKETIRKDLTVLEKQGLVVWRHGGAALTERSTAERVLSQKGKAANCQSRLRAYPGGGLFNAGKQHHHHGPLSGAAGAAGAFKDSDDRDQFALYRSAF